MEKGSRVHLYQPLKPSEREVGPLSTEGPRPSPLPSRKGGRDPSTSTRADRPPRGNDASEEPTSTARQTLNHPLDLGRIPVLLETGRSTGRNTGWDVSGPGPEVLSCDGAHPFGVGTLPCKPFDALSHPSWRAVLQYPSCTGRRRGRGEPELTSGPRPETRVGSRRGSTHPSTSGPREETHGVVGPPRGRQGRPLRDGKRGESKTVAIQPRHERPKQVVFPHPTSVSPVSRRVCRARGPFSFLFRR